MRGRAYRRHQAASHYLTRAHHLYSTYGGYIVADGKVVKRCESFKDYMENVNPYLLKTQGNFEHHAFIDEKYEQHKQKVKEKVRAKRELSQNLEN